MTGDPIGLSDYFKGTGKQHALGFLGGLIAGVAFLAGLLALGGAPGYSNRRPAQLRFEPGRAGVGRGVGLVRLAGEFKGAGERSTLLFGD